MLVLTRKAGQRIVIGDGLVITVVSVQGGTVRLGIEAETKVPVYREEILPVDHPARRIIEERR